MQSSPNNTTSLTERKVELLEQMASLYANAMESLCDGNEEAAAIHVSEAEPILRQLVRNEKLMEQRGVTTPAEVSTKTRHVQELHARLLAFLSEEKRGIERERAQLSGSKRMIHSVKAGRNAVTGHYVDGTC